MAAAFHPRYLFESELASFGLPDIVDQANIMSLVDAASSLIDEYCGRSDGDGNGSLAYTTYIERLPMAAAGRNIVRTSFRPLVAVPESTRVQLAASGSHFYTGFFANTQYRVGNVTLSPLISASGRYGYTRRDQQMVGPDLNYGINMLQVASWFGGPPQFTAIDVAGVDFNAAVGELWVPAGLYLSQYTEIVVVYNSGFDPRDMPAAIKHATAALVRNLLSRAGGTTGLRGISAGRVNAQFTEELVDPTIDRWLGKFKTVIALVVPLAVGLSYIGRGVIS